MARPPALLFILCLSALAVFAVPTAQGGMPSRKLVAPRGVAVAATPAPPAPMPTVSADGTPIIAAQGAILIDAASGEVLWGRNAGTRMPIASTTKLMTALLVCERAADKLDQQVTVSPNAAATGDSSVFGKGDQVRLRDLLRGALVCSSNEATVALAEAVAGSKDAFVALMNARARELGCTNTRFADPHGLANKKPNTGHYSTPYDLALIARAARMQPLICQYVSQRYFKCTGYPRGQIGPRPNRNRLLGKALPGAPGAVVNGMKTGYTRLAGDCLVTSATLGDLTCIAVVLNSPRLFDESAAVLAYGFTRYETRRVTPSEAGLERSVREGAPGMVRVEAQEPMVALAKRQAFGGAQFDVRFRGDALTAPLRRGQVVGAIDLFRDGESTPVASVPAVVTADVPVAPMARFLRAAGVGLLAVLALFVIGKVYGATTKAARRRRRQFTTRGGSADSSGPGLG